jgi:A/G-specific adenine glycosylase
MRAKEASSKIQRLPSPSQRRQIHKKLLAWFDRYRRDLPWRKDRDSYHIWVSEVMLQQTQVATVLRYFEPFIRSFPSIKALAAAPERQVLRAWEGMGYYRRARHLHQAAQQLVADHKGRIPNDPDVFGNLPGVGRYILGAVLSQAFERRMPIVEANSRRVFSRLLGPNGHLHATRSGALSSLWQVAEELLPALRIGDFNQALMELGALVCTPSSPRCGDCPIAHWCQARRLGLQNKIPSTRAGTKETRIREVAVIICRAGRVLLVQRPSGGRWTNMWEFPHHQVRSKESVESAARRIARKLAGLEAEPISNLLMLKHSVNQYRISLTCLESSYRAGKFQSDFYPRGRWLYPPQLQDFPLSAPHRKLARFLLSTRA